MTVLEEARKRADGDMRRCHGMRDGSIIVVNRSDFVPTVRWMQRAEKVGHDDA